MTAGDIQILEQLKRATAGLLFMSESDYGFEVIHWGGVKNLTDEYLCKVSGGIEPCRVEEMKVEDFLQLEIYRDVIRVLSDNLTDVKAYRVGERNMPVYMVGRSKAGTWLGVSTRIVWT